MDDLIYIYENILFRLLVVVKLKDIGIICNN